MTRLAEHYKKYLSSESFGYSLNLLSLSIFIYLFIKQIRILELEKHFFVHKSKMHRYWKTERERGGIGWPRLWQSTTISLHNEGLYKWVNFTPIFFWYELLLTTSGPWKFSKIRDLKVTYFHFPSKKNIPNWKHDLIFMQLSFFINKI